MPIRLLISAGLISTPRHNTVIQDCKKALSLQCGSRQWNNSKANDNIEVMGEHKAIFLLKINVLEIARKHYLSSMAFVNGTTITFKPHLNIILSCNPELRYYSAGLILIPGVFGSGLASLKQSSENLAARYRRDFGSSSTFGGIVTRRSSGDYDNTVVSFDTNYRMTDEDNFSFQYARSDTQNSDKLIEDFGLDENQSAGAYQIRYGHNDEKWHYAISRVDYDDGFRADLGFIGRVGYNKTVVGGQRTWRANDKKNGGIECMSILIGILRMIKMVNC